MKGPKKENPHIKKATKDIQIKKSRKKGKEAEMLKKAIRTHYWVIWWLIPQ